MWWRKLGFDVFPGAGSGRGGHAHPRLYSVAAPGAGGHSAECILPVFMSTAAAATKFVARHGMIDVAALHVLTTATRMVLALLPAFFVTTENLK